MSRKIGWVCWDDLRAVSLQNGIVLYLQISKCMMQLTVQNLSSCPHRRSRFWEKTTRVFFEPAKHVHHGGNSGSLQQFFIGFFKQQWGSVWKSKFSETSTNLVKWRSIQPYTATGDSKLLQIEIVKCLLFFSKVICCYDENILCPPFKKCQADDQRKNAAQARILFAAAEKRFKQRRKKHVPLKLRLLCNFSIT